MRLSQPCPSDGDSRPAQTSNRVRWPAKKRVGFVETPGVQRAQSAEIQTIGFHRRGGLRREIERHPRSTNEIEQFAGQLLEKSAWIGRAQRRRPGTIGDFAGAGIVQIGGRDDGVAGECELAEYHTTRAGAPGQTLCVFETHAPCFVETFIAQQIERAFVLHDVQVFPLCQGEREHVEPTFPQPVERTVGTLHLERRHQPLRVVRPAAPCRKGGRGSDRGRSHDTTDDPASCTAGATRGFALRRGRAHLRRYSRRHDTGNGCWRRPHTRDVRTGNRRGKIPSTGPALVGLLAQQHVDGVCRGRRQARRRYREGRYLLGEMLDEHRGRAGGIHCRRTGEHLDRDESRE